MYEHKANKYKLKYKYKTNLVGGHQDCDIGIANNYLENAFIVNDVNLIPFEKSLFHNFKNHPVCSYSVWDERRDHLYIPTSPNNNDKVFKYLDYNIRPYHTHYADIIENGVVIAHGGSRYDYTLWSKKHRKWYLVNTFPRDDNTLEKLARDMNIELQIDSNPEPKVMSFDERTNILMYLIRKIAIFLSVKNVMKLINDDEFDRVNAIAFLLSEAKNMNELPHNVTFNTAAPGYIRELEELAKTYIN